MVDVMAILMLAKLKRGDLAKPSVWITFGNSSWDAPQLEQKQ